MPEVRICFDVNFECCEIGFIHAGRVLPDRSPLNLWFTLGEMIWIAILLPVAALLVSRSPTLHWPTKWFLLGVLMLPWVHLVRRFFESTSIDSRLDTSDSRFEITVRPDGWTFSTANTRAEHQWSLIARVVRFDAGFVVVENWAGLASRWLPLTGFESAIAADQFVELVKGASVSFEDRRTE